MAGIGIKDIFYCVIFWNNNLACSHDPLFNQITPN